MQGTFECDPMTQKNVINQNTVESIPLKANLNDKFQGKSGHVVSMFRE